MSKSPSKTNTSSNDLPSLAQMKTRLNKADRVHLERILKRGSTCLMFDDQVPVTVILKDPKVEKRDGMVDIYVTIAAFDTGLHIDNISSFELLKAANLAEQAGYYEVDCYLSLNNVDAKNCSVNVRWTTGEETREPLTQVKEDDPVGLADFAKKKGLVDHPKFKWVKQILDKAKDKNKKDNIGEYLSFKESSDKPEILVKLESGNELYMSLDKLKEDDPTGLAEWAQRSKLLHLSQFVWAKDLLKASSTTSPLKPESTQKSKDTKNCNQIEKYLSFRTAVKKPPVLDVKWKSGEVTIESLTDMKNLDPLGLAQWAKKNKLGGSTQFSWINKVLQDTPEKLNSNALSNASASKSSRINSSTKSRSKKKSRESTSGSKDKPIEYLEYKFDEDKHQILTRWCPGEEKWESLENLKNKDPTGVALWAKQNNMLSTAEFKWAKTVADLFTWEDNESSTEDSSDVDSDDSHDGVKEIDKMANEDSGVSLSRDGQWVSFV